MASGITGFGAGVHVGTGSQKHLHNGQMPFPRGQNQRRHASFAVDIGVSAVSETLAHLIDLPAVTRPGIRRPEDRTPITMNHGSITLEPLTDRAVCSEISIFYATIDGSGQVGGVDGHRGEEFCYVIDGFLEVTVDGKPYVLRQGETIHFKAARPHHIRNLTNQPVRTLWAVRPKLFL